MSKQDLKLLFYCNTIMLLKYICIQASYLLHTVYIHKYIYINIYVFQLVIYNSVI